MGRNGYKVLVGGGKQIDVGKESRLGHREKSDLGLKVLVALLAAGAGIISALARYAPPHVHVGLGYSKINNNKRRNIMLTKIKN